MRQVPRVALIGNGRVAKHLAYYFKLLNIEYQHWYRKLASSVAAVTDNSSHVFILIKDDDIDPFIEAHPFLKEKILIHCSGAYESRYAYACHPLMTFGHDLYDLALYQKIGFVLDDTAPDFDELLPQLNNPWQKIAASKRGYYHALCVLASNTTILWQKFFKELNSLGIPQEIGQPYLHQIVANLIHNPQNALTGPLVRQDSATIAKNIKALDDDPFQLIYRAFVEVYTQQLKEQS